MRSARCATTSSARPATASTAPGSPIPIWCRSRSEVFDAVLGDRPNQKERQREEVQPDAAAAARPPRARAATITEAGVRNEHQRRHAVHRVLAARQRRGRDLQPDGGRGHRRDLPRAALAVAHHGAALDDGRVMTADLYRTLRDDELGKLRRFEGDRFDDARALVDRLVLADEFEEFLTLPAYELVA